MAMKANTRKVFEYLKDNYEKNLTAADIATELNLTKRQVDGIFTRAIQIKGYGVREPDEVTNPDGSHEKVKWLRLTEEGLALDLDAPE